MFLLKEHINRQSESAKFKCVSFRPLWLVADWFRWL